MKVKVVYLARLSEDIKKSEEYVDINKDELNSLTYDQILKVLVFNNIK